MPDAALLLERLSALIHQSVRDDAARSGLQPIHVQILSYLARANEYSNLPIAIAEYFGITRGTVSQSLNVLERRGLLVREPDPRHGKRIHLRLTAAGVAILDSSWTQRLETAIASLSQEGNSLEPALLALLGRLQTLNGQRPFGTCRTCAHFLRTRDVTHCALTGQSLAADQTTRICREWTQPETGR